MRARSPRLPSSVEVYAIAQDNWRRRNLFSGYEELRGTLRPCSSVLNDLDRFHLVMDAIDWLPQTGE